MVCDSTDCHYWIYRWEWYTWHGAGDQRPFLPSFRKSPITSRHDTTAGHDTHARILETTSKEIPWRLSKIDNVKQPEELDGDLLDHIYRMSQLCCRHGRAYKNARKHGLKASSPTNVRSSSLMVILQRKYAMPDFISERHHSANVYLSHYHYCTSAHNPFASINNWDKRETTHFADMSPAEFHFLRRTAKMLEERG